jgi:MFS family permease
MDAALCSLGLPLGYFKARGGQAEYTARMSQTAESPADSSKPAPREFAGFLPSEARLVFGSSAIYALRMLGVYMATPVLSPYAESLPGSTAMWVGLSLGAYGLTQAIFQIPFGVFGDRFGRRRVLFVGLAIFAVGSVVCARAATAPVLVLGRFIQGLGAMASTMIALMGDGTRESIRTRAMAGMGILLGGAFAVGLVTGPVLSASVGVPSLFGLSAVLSVLGLAAVPFVIRRSDMKPKTSARVEKPVSMRGVLAVLAKPQLLALDIGILILHMGLTSIFVILPLRLHNLVPASQQWQVYAPVIALGLGALAISSHFAERPRGAKVVFTIGSVCLASGFVLMARGDGLVPLVAALALYVIGFASTEPALAAQVTRHAEAAVRGTAAGVFNTVQFFGVFLGGLAAGAALHRAEGALFLGIASVQLLWLLAAWRIPADNKKSPDAPPQTASTGAA